MERCGISKKPLEEYRIVIQKAYYTYTSTDAEFNARMVAMLEDYGVMQKLVYSATVIPEFVKDPLEMTKEDFETFFDLLSSRYARPNVLIPSGELNLEPGKTLSNAENVTSVQMAESKEGSV